MTITDAINVADGDRLRRPTGEIGTVLEAGNTWLTVRWTDGTESKLRRTWLFPFELLPPWTPDEEGGQP